MDNLRKFHNWVKTKLLTKATKYIEHKQSNKKINLLDLAVGRGGDLHKWNKLNIDTVIGIDIDKPSIEEANKRYTTHKFYKTKVNLHAYDLRNPAADQFIQKYYNNIKFDIISCQFALHYFFESKEIFNSLMKLVSNRLNKGGLFIGTTLDGKKIQELLKNTNISKGRLYTIKKNYEDDRTNLYGKMYQMTIGKTDDKSKSYFAFAGESSEYLVDINELVRIANKNNMKLVGYKSFRKLYETYKQETHKQMTPDEKIPSFLNFSFVFQKI